MAAANSEYLKKINMAGLRINRAENGENYTERVSVLCICVAGSFAVRQLDLLE